MDKESIKERKESQNGSTGQTTDSQTKDGLAEKATVLHKNVSKAACPWVSFHISWWLFKKRL